MAKKKAVKEQLQDEMELTSEVTQAELLQTILALKKEVESLKKYKTSAVKNKEKSKIAKALKSNAEEKPKELNITRTKVGFKENKFVDDGTECQTDKLFDKKYGKHYKVQARKKPPAQLVINVCSRCGSKRESYLKEPFWICPSCAKV